MRKSIVLLISIYSSLFFFLDPYLGHPVIDTYTDLWTGFEIFHGKTLFKNILYPYGPFIPELFALFFKVFKSTVIVSYITSYFFGLYLLGQIYFFLRGNIKKESDVFFLTGFLLLLLFYNPVGEIFSVIRTYSWSTVLYISFYISLIGIHINKNKKPHIVKSLCFFTLCTLTRSTMFLPVGFVYLLFLSFKAPFKGRFVDPFFHLVFLIISCGAYFYLNESFQPFWNFTLAHGDVALNSSFHHMLMGLDRPIEHILEIIGSSFLMLICYFTIKSKKFSLQYMAIFIFLISLFYHHSNYTSAYLFVSLPVLNLILVVHYLRKRDYLYAAWGTLNAISILRFSLNFNIDFCSIYFSIPIFLYLMIFVINNVKEKFEKKKMFALFLMVLTFSIVDDVKIFKMPRGETHFLGKKHFPPTLEFVTHRYITVEKDFFKEISLLVRYIKEKDISGFQVFPSGTILNLEFDSPSPIALLPLVPTLLLSLEKNSIINELKSKKIEHIIILNRKYPEYNETYFGDSFGKEIMMYIKGEYHIIKQSIGYYTVYKKN